MTTESAAEKPVRPRTVDYALYAIAARCVSALLLALAVPGHRNVITEDITNAIARENKKAGSGHQKIYSASQLHDLVSSNVRYSIFFLVIGAMIVAVLAKFIRDGRNWSRWVYTIASFFPLGDVFKVTYFFAPGQVQFKLAGGLMGLAAIVSIALLFVRPSIAYFKPAGPGRASPFAGFLKSRIPPAAQPKSTPAPTTSVAPAKRPAPRAKSRKASSE